MPSDYSISFPTGCNNGPLVPLNAPISTVRAEAAGSSPVSLPFIPNYLEMIGAYSFNPQLDPQKILRCCVHLHGVARKRLPFADVAGYAERR